MGMNFDEDVCEELMTDFNGNPFLIRQACSYIHCFSSSSRLIVISKELYLASKEKIEASLNSEIDLILESLEQRYSEEYELLKYLANRDHETFSYYAKLSSKYIEHLKKYGVVREETSGYSICIKAVEKRLKDRLQFNVIPKYAENKTVMDLIGQGESSTLEFKASLLWDFNKSQKDRELEKEVLKAIASFMNSSGGTLLIGIKDDETILGLDYALKAMKWTDFDKYQRHLANDILANKVGGNLACLCNISFPKVGSKYICKVDVTPSGIPVEINYKKGESQQEKKYFFVRNSGSAKFLEGIDMARYCARHWTGGF